MTQSESAGLPRWARVAVAASSQSWHTKTGHANFAIGTTASVVVAAADNSYREAKTGSAIFPLTTVAVGLAPRKAARKADATTACLAG